MIRVGPAGWSYPDSPGHVYPADAPQKFDVLSYLARFFDTVEINASFYAPQPPRSYASWARRVSANPRFRFTAKLWQRFTHGSAEYGRAATPDAATFEPWSTAEVTEVTQGLAVLRDAGRLGAVRAQFPWSFRPSPASTERLTRLAEDFAGWPLVVELRHGAWASRDTSHLLKRLGVGFCNIDQPVIGESLGPTAGVTSALGYVRLHGRNYADWFGEQAERESWRRYNYLYSTAELAPWLERIRTVAAAPGVGDVYVVANNHFQGQGPANALMIRAMLEGRKVPVPPTLYATYELSLADWGEPAEE
ncbi:MAG: hypothetical protein A2085_10885 [Gemmatimonadetes bacterium GWC2_71_10]|nr:MAG: hypothetical protein A2085_10885 [Gemmatimonadetes bacterium GWC2_71_10]